MKQDKRLIDIFSVSFNEIGASSIAVPKKSRIVKKNKPIQKEMLSE
jgi:hypothetical protein